MLIDKSDNSNHLKKINELVITCKKCSLSSGRKNAVPGVGPPFATLMFVGEAPGSKEDEIGLPFVGNFPILWLGTPFEIMHFCSEDCTTVLLIISKKQDKIIK